MQDVTDLAFWRLISTYGGPDLYFTEYFRVHATSTLEKHILQSILENPSGKPVIAQMIGSSRETVSRTMRDFVERGLITVTRREITLSDRAGLEQAAGRA